MTDHTDPNELITLRDLAMIRGKKASQVSQWKFQGKLPPYDVEITKYEAYWRRQTLVDHRIILANEAIPTKKAA